MSEMGRRKAEDNTNFKKIVQACREAGPFVTERLRELLEEEKRASEESFAAQRAELSGAWVTAKLPANLTQREIERAWRFEQYVTTLPVIAVSACDGVVNFAYFTFTGQEHTAEGIKRHFESAIHRAHPEINVEWL
jgi:hypothetical protein